MLSLLQGISICSEEADKFSLSLRRKVFPSFRRNVSLSHSIGMEDLLDFSLSLFLCRSSWHSSLEGERVKERMKRNPHVITSIFECHITFTSSLSFPFFPFSLPLLSLFLWQRWTFLKSFLFPLFKSPWATHFTSPLISFEETSIFFIWRKFIPWKNASLPKDHSFFSCANFWCNHESWFLLSSHSLVRSIKNCSLLTLHVLSFVSSLLSFSQELKWHTDSSVHLLVISSHFISWG